MTEKTSIDADEIIHAVHEMTKAIHERVIGGDGEVRGGPSAD